MRRPLNLPTNDAAWVTSEFIIYDQFGNPVAPNAACGNLEQRRSVNCVRRGEVVGDSFCRDTPKPIGTFTEFLDAGCTYTWLAGGFQDPGPTCSNAEVQTQVVECRRDLDNVVVDDVLCGAGRPPSTQTVVDHSTCTYSWNPGGFQDPGPACNLAEVWTQTIDCRRDLDNVAVAESFCDAGSRPPETEVREDLSTCTYSWTAAPTFTDPGDSCTNSEVQTRAVWCRRDLDQNVEPDGRCNPAQRPASSQTVEDYSACTYSWESSPWQDPGASCSANEIQTRTNACRRSDGTIVTEGCDPATQPSTQQTVEDFSSCTFSWASTPWSAWSNTCSDTATRSRTVTCLRSDGTTVANSSCTGTAPPSSEGPTPVYTGCSYEWVSGAWQDPGAQCTANETQTRSVICRRSNGATVADSFCTGTKPATSQTVQDFSACTFSWVEGPWQDPGASCGNETQTRSVICRRNDGTTVANSSCTGTAPASSQVVSDFSGCSFSWQTDTWSGWSSTCSTNATRTRSVFCQRQDGTTVSDSSCNSATRPPSSETSSVLSGCGYTWITGNWQDPGASCTPSETQTRSVQCRRSDGAIVDDSLCGGGRPAGSQTVADYSGCQSGLNLTVNWGAWSGYNSSCSDSATRSRTGTCLASGQTVASNVCTDRGLALSQNESTAIYSGCSYSASYTAWGSCLNGSQSRTMTACTNTTLNRNVSFTECNNRGMLSTESRSCSTVRALYCTNREVPGNRLGFIEFDGSLNAPTFPITSRSGIYSGYSTPPNNVNAITGLAGSVLWEMCRQAGGTCVEYNWGFFELDNPGNEFASGNVLCLRNSTPYGPGPVYGNTDDSTGESGSAVP